MEKKVTILGAGPVGIIISNILSLTGWKVNLYEMKHFPGGMCRSWVWKKNILDTGPHIFHTNNKELWNYWRRNFGKLLNNGKYFSQVVRGKNFSKYDFYPISKELINSFDKKLKKKITDEQKNLKFNKSDSATNFKHHIRNQMGETLQLMYFQDYPEKVWGMKVDEMTSEWAPKRIKLLDKISPFFNKEFTAVGKYGTGKIYEEILNKANKSNLNIMYNHKLTKIEYSSKKIQSLIFNNKKKISVTDNEIIISTLPITLLSKMLNYQSKLSFRGIRSVYILINKKKIIKTKAKWLYFPQKEIIFNRITEPKKMSKNLCPTNQSYLTAEITYNKNDKYDKMSLKNLKEIIIKDLLKTGLVKNQKEIIDISDNKEDYVYPKQFSNYKEELAKTMSRINHFSQVFSLGTGGEFNYADSQILFKKSFDLCKMLNNKSINYAETKNTQDYSLNKKVKLGNSIVGENEKPYIIAEAGLNHNGDIKIAKKLIDEAKICGADSIKFQSYDLSSRVSKKVRSANYFEKADGLQEDLNEFFNRVRIDKNFHKDIFKYAKKRNLRIFSTPFDEKSVDLLEDLKVDFYKIASVDAINLPLIRRVGETSKPLILSTGMCNISNIEEAINEFKKTKNKNLILLHCLSSYPASEFEANLNVIETLKKAFKVPVGLSDHFPGLEISLLSLGMGANIIEKHFTLNKSYEGPDHILSAEPVEMKKLCYYAKNINIIKGSGIKKIQPSEFQVLNTQRKSIYANSNLKKGDQLKKKDIIIKGPSGGLEPKYLDIILNKKVTKDIEKDTPITWENFLKS